MKIIEKQKDIYFMRQALALAQGGRGLTAPNPMVGACIVQQGKIIAEGFHRAYGEDHAEVMALKKAGKKARGTTMYITLEPCTHWGKTPPCVDAIVAAGVARVVFAMRDPNPKVRARDAVKVLRKAKIAVTYGVLEKEARELNKVFIKNIEHQMPYVIWKSAITLDGKIATKTGDSKWVTGSAARKIVHELRYQVDAVLVGKNTVICDDPHLTVRLPGKQKKIYKIVLGARSAMPKKTALLNDPLAIFVDDSRDLPRILRWLYEEYRIGSILVEGGSMVNAAFLKARLIDEFYLFVAPKIIGGDGVSIVPSLAITEMQQAKALKIMSTEVVGSDILLRGVLF